MFGADYFVDSESKSLIMPYVCTGTVSVMPYLSVGALLTQRESSCCGLSKSSCVIASDPHKTSDEPYTSTFTSHGAPDGVEHSAGSIYSAFVYSSHNKTLEMELCLNCKLNLIILYTPWQ